MIKVEDMMTRNPHTLLRSHNLGDAKNMMTALDIRHIPIVDANKKLLGVVSHRDVLAAQESSLQALPESQSYTLKTPLYEVMKTSVMTVDPQAGLKESAVYMQKHKVGCLPWCTKATWSASLPTVTLFLSPSICLSCKKSLSRRRWNKSISMK